MSEIETTAPMTPDEQRATLVPMVKSRPPAEAATLLEEYPADVIGSVLLSLNPAFSQDILAALPGGLVDGIMKVVQPERARQWTHNAVYPEDTIGRMMEPAFSVFPPAMTVAQTVTELRTLVQKAFITYGYVVDPQGKLLGIITMRDLLFAADETRLADIMLRDVFSLRPEQPLEDAMRQVLDRHYPFYPVCDGAGILLGLVRGQAMFEEHSFDITAQAGTMVGVEKEERLTTHWLQSFKFRHPWLQLNLLTAFVAGAVVGMFEGTVERLVVLAAFLPVLAGQSGNTGCQALAVTLRGMTLGELKPGQERELVFKEALLGAMNGAFTGLIAGGGMYAYASKQNLPEALWLAFVVWLALVGACVVSGICGALIPLTLKRIGADPATASSIFLTTATDVVSMGLLLGLATILV
ncbi:MAG: magnesium transporter [Gammaproteobacteria bacterium RIFCSPLOWO2_02_FULL_61_13]|nr:MAG: magnesium transporter [Gammaproteobacteria bacterium RIFCSPLOWO2_02_FULL_61_13]